MKSLSIFSYIYCIYIQSHTYILYVCLCVFQVIVGSTIISFALMSLGFIYLVRSLTGMSKGMLNA